MIGTHAIERLREARSLRERLFGLTLERNRERCFMIFRHCRAIHTCFMRLPIDILFLDEAMRVVEIRREVKPWRFIVGPPRASVTVELPAGHAGEERIQTGDVVQWQ